MLRTLFSLPLVLLHVAVLLQTAHALDCYPNLLNAPLTDAQALAPRGNIFQSITFSSTLNLPQGCEVNGAIAVSGSDVLFTLNGNNHAISRPDSMIHFQLFRVLAGAHLVISDLSVSSYHASPLDGFGGLFFVEGAGSRLDLQNSVLRNGTARFGGAIWAGAGTSVTLTNTLIEDCSAANGGGIFSVAENASSVELVSSTIRSNTAQRGGGVYTHWGGVVSMDATSSIASNTAPIAPNLWDCVYHTSTFEFACPQAGVAPGYDASTVIMTPPNRI